VTVIECIDMAQYRAGRYCFERRCRGPCFLNLHWWSHACSGAFTGSLGRRWV